jgi:hypothetical protein
MYGVPAGMISMLALQSIPCGFRVGGLSQENILYIPITILQHTASTMSVFTALTLKRIRYDPLFQSTSSRS